MSLSAVVVVDGENRRIYASDYEHPRIELDGQDLRCPDCNEPMYVKEGSQVVPHFAHYADSDCPYASNGSGESEEHYATKVKLRRRLMRSKRFHGAQIDNEIWLPEIGRRADVLANFDNRYYEVHEVQLSAITLDDIAKRTDDYRSLGYTVRWWLGHNANKENVRDWCMGNGCYGGAAKTI